MRVSVRDHFQRRKLVRQLEDLADQIAERTRPNYEHEFRNVAENERAAALLAVVDALKAADLTDDTLFAVDVDARNLARLVRERIPVRHPVRVAALGASAPDASLAGCREIDIFSAVHTTLHGAADASVGTRNERHQQPLAREAC